MKKQSKTIFKNTVLKKLKHETNIPIKWKGTWD